MLCVLPSFYSANAQTVEAEQDTEAKDAAVLSWYDLSRFSFKTNAVDWMAIIPNFGVEYQLFDSPYKFMTVGLSAKWNWSSYHGTVNGKRYQPASVYDVFDLRPEFRFYYRPTPISKSRVARANKLDAYDQNISESRELLKSLRAQLLKTRDEKTKEDLRKYIAAEEANIAKNDSLKKTMKQSFPDWFMTNIWTTERKNARNWRAHYIGGYVNYANYRFKFGERGIEGKNTFGFGATAGYVLPLYEYNKGAIDIDLGFSVGLQMAKHSVFTHSMDGNYYSKLQEGRTWYGTQTSSDRWLPYPVVSELRVAFVWRKTSIKHKVKTNWEAIKAAEKFERYKNSFYTDLDLHMSLSNYKKSFDESNSDKLSKWRKNDTLYRQEFINSLEEPKKIMMMFIHTEQYGFTDEQVEKFTKVLEKREADIIKNFDKQRAHEKKQEEAKAKSAATPPKEKVEKPVKEKPVKEKPVKEKPEKKDKK